MAERFVNDRSMAATEKFIALAEEVGMNIVTMATAWSKQHDYVASTIVGVSHEDHLEPIIAAANMTLDTATLKKIDQVSQDIPYPMV